jgi:sec-independent protein translocase protein TatA
MFENLTLPHILIVLVIVLLLFGAKRIPEIAGSMGKGIREFKKNVHDGASDADPNATRAEPSALPPKSELGTRVDEPRAEPKRLL